MSHFNTLVLVKSPSKHVKDDVARLMAPYYEGKSAPRRRENCNCVGDVAKRQVDLQAELKFPSWDALRAEFKRKNPEIERERLVWKESFTQSDARPVSELKKLQRDYHAWESACDLKFQALIKPKNDWIKSAFQKHPLRRKPDPTCGFYDQPMIDNMKKRHPEKHKNTKPGDRYHDKSGCGGTGKIWTTYNPKSQWDWYQIGGRWTGDLSDTYDPRRDPENMENCRHCGGTGKRTDSVGASLHPPFHCNGCDGKGRCLKWDFVPFSGDIVPADAVPTHYLPHALVTPDGKWHQESTMGWFGMSGEKDPQWKAKVARLLKRYRKTTIAVVVDCHI